MCMVLIIGNDRESYEVLRPLLGENREVKICNQAEGEESVLGQVRRLGPKLILLDMSENPPARLTETLRQAVPETPIFLVTATYNAQVEKAAIASGVTAVFSKLDDREALRANARAVLQEESQRVTSREPKKRRATGS